MSFLGNVFNKAAGKSIPVYLATSSQTFWRPTRIISQKVKNLAFTKTKAAFKSGNLFKDDDMKNMASLKITHMPHESENDRNSHYSIQGEDSSGSKIKDGHVQQDESK